MRRDTLLRFIIAPLLSTVTGIVILRIGDHFSLFGPFSRPSLIEVPTGLIPAIFPWISAVGAAAGAISAITAGFSDNRRNVEQGFTLTALSFVLICLVQTLSIQGLMPITDYLFGVAIRLFYLTLIGFLGALFGNLAGAVIVNLLSPRRSALEIMPDELRERFLQEQAARREKALPHRLRHLFGQNK